MALPDPRLMEGQAAFLEGELRARRDCFVGARQDVQTALTTLENAESLELAKTALVPILNTRLELLDLAVSQVDEALGGIDGKARIR